MLTPWHCPSCIRTSAKCIKRSASLLRWKLGFRTTCGALKKSFSSCRPSSRRGMAHQPENAFNMTKEAGGRPASLRNAIFKVVSRRPSGQRSARQRAQQRCVGAVDASERDFCSLYERRVRKLAPELSPRPEHCRASRTATPINAFALHATRCKWRGQEAGLWASRGSHQVTTWSATDLLRIVRCRYSRTRRTL